VCEPDDAQDPLVTFRAATSPRRRSVPGRDLAQYAPPSANQRLHADVGRQWPIRPPNGSPSAAAAERTDYARRDAGQRAPSHRLTAATALVFAVVVLFAGAIALRSTGATDSPAQPAAVSTAAAPLTSVQLCNADSWRIADLALAPPSVPRDC
jgi:hypothetical protein